MNAIALPYPRTYVLTLFLLYIFGAELNSVFAQPVSQANLLQKCWEMPTQAPFVDGIGSDKSAIYLSTGGGRIRAISIAQPDPLWSAELGGSISSNLVVTQASLFVVSSPAPVSIGEEKQMSTLRSISKQTGITNWSIKIPFAESTYLLEGDKGIIVAAGSDSSISAISQQNGNIIWNNSVPGNLTGRPDFKNNRIAFATTLNDVFILSTADSVISKRLQFKFLPTAVSFANDGGLLVGDERGNLVLVDAKDGKNVWKFKNGARISHAFETGRGILLASYDNYVYLLTASRGGVIWKRRLSGRISDAPVVLDDMLFVRTSGDRLAYLISMRNGKIVIKLDLGDSDVLGEISLSPDNPAIVIAGTESIALYGLRACPPK